MIYAYTGRRSPSILPGFRDHLGDRLRKLLTQSAPSAIVGAAACGADLMILAEALRLHARRGHPDVRVVLPTPAARFREDSVEPEWGARFDDALAEVRERGELVELAGDAEDPYLAGNAAILRDALALAARRDERVVALVVAGAGEGEYAERFVAHAALRDVRALRIDPAVRRAQQRRCFVVMPYQVKWDPHRSFKMNCDLTYGRLLVPALEHAQLDYRRADETVDPGIVLRPMIDDIAQADVLIADLATGNFNVGWELGLRHLLKDHTTILIKPAGNVPAPFDVQALRSVAYDHDADGFTDDAVLDAWAVLEPLLEPGAGYGEDSPVRATMDVELARIQAIGRAERLVQELRDDLADARDLGDANRIESIVARAAALDPPDLRLVQAEAGTIMRRLGLHERAQQLLEPIIAADPQVYRPAAHQELAMALYRRPGAQDADYRRAEEILRRVVSHGGYPETEALLGAVAKRRARGLTGDDRITELRLAQRAYLTEYERNLNDHYSGVNVLAICAVLGLVHADEAARDDLLRLVPAVRVAVGLRLRQAPHDYWARASAAETELLAVLSGLLSDEQGVLDAYRHAAKVRPLPDEVASSLDQLQWYEHMGLSSGPLKRAAAALSEAFEQLA